MLRNTYIRREMIAFIGLGQMGSRMAPNLLKVPENTLRLFDVNTACIEDTMSRCCASLKGRVAIAESVQDAIQHAQVVITMLPNGDLVRSVYNEILLAGKYHGKLFLDCSTINYNIPKEISSREEMKQQQHMFFDCPVSGGIQGAEQGTLTFMVGGDPFEKAQEILKPMSSHIFHCGRIGAGQACKLSNNLILAQTMIAVSEGMQLGTQLGIQPDILAQIVSRSSGQCWSSDKYNPYPNVVEKAPSSRNYEGGFSAALMLKDVKLALEAAQAQKLPTPGLETAKNLYEEIVQSGSGTKDFSYVFQKLKKLN